jgi:hypothetical protein
MLWKNELVLDLAAAELGVSAPGEPAFSAERWEEPKGLLTPGNDFVGLEDGEELSWKGL